MKDSFIKEIENFTEAIDAYIAKKKLCLVDLTSKSVFVLRHLTDSEKDEFNYVKSIHYFGFHRINNGNAPLWNTVKDSFFDIIRVYIPLMGRKNNKNLFLYAVYGKINSDELLEISAK